MLSREEAASTDEQVELNFGESCMSAGLHFPTRKESPLIRHRGYGARG
jgi:hypothetical protein